MPPFTICNSFKVFISTVICLISAPSPTISFFSFICLATYIRVFGNVKPGSVIPTASPPWLINLILEEPLLHM